MWRRTKLSRAVCLVTNSAVRKFRSANNLSPCGLGSQGKRLELLADLDLARRVQLVHIDILELEHEPYPVVRVPVERDSADLLLATIDPAGAALRHAGDDVAVEIDCAVASRDFQSADAALCQAEWVIGVRPAPGSPIDIVGVGLAGQHHAALDIAAVEAEHRRGNVRQFRLIYVDLVELALHQVVAPIGPDAAAVNIGAARGYRARVDELVKTDPELGLIGQRDCLLAYSRHAAGVQVRVEHVLAGGLSMEVPILI